MLRKLLVMIVLGLPIVGSCGGAWRQLPCWHDSCSEIDFWLLYMRPSSAQQVLALSASFASSPAHSNGYLYQSHYDLGYRVSGRRWFCGHQLFAEAGVTWFHGAHTVQKFPLPGGSLVSGVQAFPGSDLATAIGRERARYLSADLTLGHLLASCCGLQAYVFGGARYADISIENRGRYSALDPQATIVNSAHTHFRFHGVGPRLGFDFSWFFCSCVGFVGRLGSSMLFATRPVSSELNSDNSSIALQSHASNLNSLTWALDGKLGLQIAVCLGSRFRLCLEGGAVLDYILDAIQSPESIPQFFAQRSLPFSIGGPYGRVAVSF